MVNFLAGIALALFSTIAQAKPSLPVSHCVHHNPYGVATAKERTTPICRLGYYVSYDNLAKIPRYVSYTILPGNAIGCIGRTNNFSADHSVTPRAELDDYNNSGFDRGHAVPDADLSWSATSKSESFLLTNVYPQAPSLNRAIWRTLETSVRGWASQSGHWHTIYVGGIYNRSSAVIGDGVTVPDGFYKIVINQTTSEVAGWAFPHRPPYDRLPNDLSRFRLPVANIVELSGVAFKFPRGAVELPLDAQWAVDFGRYNMEKRKKCNANK